MIKPLISIIIVTYNAQGTIEECIKSILSQSKCYELIVIDGLSTDNTVCILEKYKKDINYFISEKDQGIYHAMNKGIDACNGEFIYFIGSDDVFYSEDTINKIKNSLQNNRPDLILGNIKYYNGLTIKPRFNSLLVLHNSIHHQGTFYNRKLFEEFRFDENYRIIADYELNLRCYINKSSLKIIKTDLIIALCSKEGLSHSSSNLFLKETNEIRSKYFNVFTNYFLNFLLLFKLKLINSFKS
jgi:glycosyltransferase involved in cell wall biosynthesis